MARPGNNKKAYVAGAQAGKGRMVEKRPQRGDGAGFGRFVFSPGKMETQRALSRGDVT